MEKTKPPSRGLLHLSAFCRKLVFLLVSGRRQEIPVTAFEFVELALFDNLRGAALPCGVGEGIDIKLEHVPGLAVGAAGLIFRSVGHNDGDFVVIGVYIGLHGLDFPFVITSKSLFYRAIRALFILNEATF